MRAFADLTIQRKLTVISMAAAGLALVLSCVSVFTYEILTFRRELVSRMSAQAQIVGTNSASAVLFQDPGVAAATLSALRAEPQVVSARIHTPDGALFASYVRDGSDGPAAAPGAPPALTDGHAFGGDGLFLYRPITVDNAAVGTVVIHADLSERKALLARYAFILVGVLLVSLAVVHATATRLHRAITGPVLHLVATANAVSERRDYSVRATSAGQDELGLLVRTFNDMLDQIQDRDAALQRGRDELEAQVDERTRALRATNRELEEQSRRVQEATRLKSEFLANMSHELRTPLNAIIGFAELMHDAKVGPVSEAHQECLADILTSSRHLLQLINDVLDLSKVEAGKMEFRPEPVDLTRLVTEVRDILRGLAAKKRIQIGVEVDPAVGEVVVDPGKLKQILYNYLSNALKFTREGGRVVVRAKAEGADRFRLAVEDNGIGIRPEDIARLFSEFQQLDASASKAYQGTGLGLALTKRIVDAQGGHIGVTSVLGQGSMFFAVLPRKGRAPAVEAPAAAPRTPPGAPTLLVIEDDTKERAWLVETLGQAGYAVEVAATGREAIDRCAQRAYDGITLDLLLPDMGGWDVLKAIRAGGPNHATPTIVVTVVTERGVGAGYAIHDYLSKPVRAEDLLSSLSRAKLRPPLGRPVLVVDDDPKARRLMETTLQSIGYPFIEAASAEEGLRLARTREPSAVILDLSMPGMDGFEFLERFRGMAEGRGTPVIIWTVRDLTAEDHARLAASAQAVVLKGGTGRLIEEIQAYVPAPAPGVA